MYSRLRPLRILLPLGVISQFRLPSKSHARKATCNDAIGNTDDNNDPEASTGTQLSRQLEAWLLPVDKEDSLGPMLTELRDAVSEDTHMSAEERQRLPLNLLVLKALHDRSNVRRTEEFSERHIWKDREILLKAARFSAFAAASYGALANIGHMKNIVAKEGTMCPSHVLMNKAENVDRWFISKHTSVELDDVKEVVTTASAETRAYFVAVDHSTSSVVLSIRGTLSLSDTMVDLLCKPVDFAGGRAHQGISQSAVSVWNRAKDQVESLLREHDDYQLVLTGHSLGAGTAVLLKIALSRTYGGDAEPLIRIDAGRPVHVECYAFAPPPVFAQNGAVAMQGVFSFVNGFDCVPTVSMGSLYSLFRTLRNIDQLQLDVYQRSLFVLDSWVRSQQKDLEAIAKVGEDAHSVASNIVDLTKRATALFPGSDEDGESSPATKPDRAREPTEREDTKEGKATGDVRGALSCLEKEITRLTQDVSDAADNLLVAFDKVGETAEQLYEDVGRVSEGVRSMTSKEFALTALLVKRLAGGGGGASFDEMLDMVRKCEQDGSHPGEETHHHDVTVGDLTIPGRVFLLTSRGGAGPQDNGGTSGGRVRRTSSRELGGIRLSNSMVDDHSMDAYELAILEAAQRYSRD